ncbi:50S ribosomal protein L5 [Candidatus Dependentiae bacterium]
MKQRLDELYKSKMKKELQKELGLKNIMQVPRLLKIVLNTGVKEAVQDSKVLNNVRESIGTVAGQLAQKTYAHNSIAGFKIREGAPIGVMVTLRGKLMYAFLDKLINVVLPCVRDFRGLKIKFDGSGNYNLGIKDWMVFPEMDYDKVEGSRGLNITIHTSAKNDSGVHALLKAFNMPFSRSDIS